MCQRPIRRSNLESRWDAAALRAALVACVLITAVGRCALPSPSTGPNFGRRVRECCKKRDATPSAGHCLLPGMNTKPPRLPVPPRPPNWKRWPNSSHISKVLLRIRR